MTWPTRKRWRPPPRPGKLVYAEALRLIRPAVAEQLAAEATLSQRRETVNDIGLPLWAASPTTAWSPN